jgi:hypothetical protein
MKLSWQEAHFMLMPRKDCETLCANWISTVCPALTSPRHLMPSMKPRLSSFGGAMSSRTNWSKGMLFGERCR